MPRFDKPCRFVVVLDGKRDEGSCIASIYQRFDSQIQGERLIRVDPPANMHTNEALEIAEAMQQAYDAGREYEDAGIRAAMV